MGDPTSQAIVQAVATVATPIKDTVCEYINRHSSYLFCYKGKIKKLQDEIKDLREKRDRIQVKVDIAKNNAEVIYDDVLLWLTEVQIIENKVDDFLANDSREKKQCFNCSCPNLIWRHRLGKGAEENTITVVNFKEMGGKFESLEVSHSAPFPAEMLAISSEDYMPFESRALTFSKILEALKDSNVKMILVHGPGGVGKTRMVKEATKQVNKGELFEQVVEATFSKDPNVRDIQDQLAAQLNLNFDSDGVFRRKAKLYNRLKDTKKKVLVIMDDVWKKEDMDHIEVPFTNCKILVTSRYGGLCGQNSDQKDFSIGVLKEMEAWQLFKKIVGDIYVDESRAKQVCEECGCLPIAILVVGAYLKGKDTHAWNNALNKLQHANMPEIPGIGPKIYTSLELSYDNLNSTEKSLFLLFSLFPDDAEVAIDDLVRYSMGLRLLSDVATLDKARDSVHTSIEYLKSSNLLLNGKNKHFAKMHDIIRDVAIYIAKRKKSQTENGILEWPEAQQFLVNHNIQVWPEKGTWEFSSAISLRSSNVKLELSDDFCCPCPKLHTLILKLGMLEVPQRFFVGMEKVTVLVLIEMSMLSLPPSLENLVNLRMLFLNSCKLKDLKVLEKLKDSIEILSLKGSEIEVLPSEIGQLTCLRLLDLENVWPLEVVPKGVFSELLKLEELYVSKSFKNWGCINVEDEREFNASQLTTLHIHLPNVEVIHKNFALERLIGFRISVGDDSDLRDGFSSSTRILRISSVDIKDELKILLEKTEKLYLAKLEGLRCLDHLLGEPKCSLRSFCELTVLEVHNCGFKYLFSPPCERSLRQLQRLIIKQCKNLEQVIGIEGENDEEEITFHINFSNLKWMEMSELPKLVSFYGRTTIIAGSSSSRAQSLFDDQVSFPLLQDLNIRGLINIIKIWEVESMMSLPPQLKLLHIDDCPELEVIVSVPEREKEATSNNDDVITFSALEWLNLWKLPNFKKIHSSMLEGQYLFNHQISFPLLKNLMIAYLRNIIKIWEVESMISLPPQLKLLHINDCPNLEVIVSVPEREKEATSNNDDVITFSALEQLYLVELSNFKKFYSSMPDGRYLFNHQVSFPLLKALTIRGLRNIIKIWEVEGMMLLTRQLMILEIGDCPELEVIFSILERVKEATSKNDDVITFSAILWLTLQNLPNFRKFYSSMPDGRYLFNHQVEFPHLEWLTICDLKNIEEVWSDTLPINSSKLFARLQSLLILEIEKCDSLQVIFKSEGWNEADIVKIDARDKAGTVAEKFMFPPNLRHLMFRELLSLESFFSETPLFQLPSTVMLIVENCPKWRQVPNC